MSRELFSVLTLKVYKLSQLVKMSSTKFVPQQILTEMISFDSMPDTDAGIVRMARYDLSTMRNIAKFRNALKTVNACKVSRSSTQIEITYFKKGGDNSSEIRGRLVYRLIPPFG